MEEAYIGAEEFCARVRQEEAAVLRAEPALLQALRFDLITYSPFRALAGFVMVRRALLHAGCGSAACGACSCSVFTPCTALAGMSQGAVCPALRAPSERQHKQP